MSDPGAWPTDLATSTGDPFDLAGIDRKLQHVDSIQQSWGLPPLPDETKLDLASQHGTDHHSLGDFLWGLATDINAKVNPLSAAPAAADDGQGPIVVPGVDSDPGSLHNQVRKAFADLSGNPPSKVLADDAVEQLKLRAVRKGLLPADTAIDGTYDPALETVRAQLADQEFKDRVSGDRTGNLTIKSVMDFVGDFAAPSNLAKTATALGVIPSIGRLKEQEHRAHNSWSDWIHDPINPGKFLKALAPQISFVPVVGAAATSAAGLGELLDSGSPTKAFHAAQTAGADQLNVALPLVNDLLLLTGVGEVISIGRAAFGAAEAADVASTGFRTLYAARGAADLERAREASLLSRGLVRTGTGLMARDGALAGAGQRLFNTGTAMQQWRELKGVAAARAAAGVLGRRAIVGTAEQKLFPELDLYSGSPANLLGANIHSGADLDAFKHRGSGNPITAALDVTLAPPSYFQPGSVTQIGKGTAALAKAFLRVSDDERLTTEVARGLAGLTTDPAKAAALRGRNPTQALVEHFGGDKELAGKFTTWATTIAAIDRDAVAGADRAAGSQFENPAKWKRIYLQRRNGQIAKLAHIDEGDVDTFVNRLAPKVAKGHASEAMAEWSNRLGSGDPEAHDLMNGLIRDHNDKRAGVMTSLVGQLQRGDVESHVQRFFNNDADFSKFLESNDLVDRMFGSGGIMDGTPLLMPDAVPGIDEAAQRYAKRLGLTVRPVRAGLQADQPTATRMALAYDELPTLDKSPAATAAYGAFAADVDRQYKYMTEELGIKVVPVKNDPYGSPAEMMADIRDNKRLKVHRTAADQAHPLLTNEQNDHFRAVHDFFGHAGLGNDFSRHGEEVAFARHAQMFTPEARGALATETRGQNSFLNFHPDNQGRQLAGELSQFPEQKAALLPPDFWHREDAYLYTPEYSPAFSPAGRVVGNTGKDVDPVATVTQHLYEIMRHQPDAVSNAYFAPLARRIQPGNGRFALAKTDSVVKQDALELLASIKTTKRHVGLLRWLEGNTNAQETFASAIAGGANPAGMTRAEFLDAVRESFAAGVKPGTFDPGLTPKAHDTANLISNLSKRTDEYDFADLAGAITGARQNLENNLASLELHPSWSSDYGIPQDWALDRKVKELSSLHQTMAAEVTGLPDSYVAQLKGLGYKVVHGGEFVMPKDVLDTVRPFTEVKASHMAKMSLGSFITPVENQAAARAVAQQLHSNLTGRLTGIGVLDGAAVAKQLDRNEAGVPGQIIKTLWRYVSSGQDATDAKVLLAKDGGLLDRFIANVGSSLTPLGLRDLSYKKIGAALRASDFPEIADMADNPRAVNAIQAAIKDSYNVGARFNGLAALEDHLRSHNLFTDGLKVLSRTESAAMIQRAKRAGVGAAIGGALGTAGGVMSGQSLPQALGQGVQGAVVGGAFGAAPAGVQRAGSRALIGGVAGGLAGGAAAGDFKHGFVGGALAGGLSAALPGEADPISKLANAAEAAVSGTKWYRYGYLPDELARVRNLARFTLNPMFDMRRYTKGALIAHLQQLPEDVTLPANLSLKALERSVGPAAAAEARQMWNAASKGEYGILDDTERYFAQRGVLGYSGKDFMAATNWHLVKQGVDPEKAADITRKIYAYGNGRSPLEKSVNFVFFPFSFERKLIGNTAKFLSQDMSRVVVLHDALKTYDVLNQHFDLSSALEEHLPVLHELEKLNAFQHGIGPGEFGGINAPILNLFLPQMLHLDNPDDAHSLQHTLQRLMPAYNDVDRMVGDLAEQGHVLFSTSHMTSKAEADQGYAHWNAFKDSMDRVARESGFKDGYASLQRSNGLDDVKQYIAAYRAELERRLPGFAAARTRNLAHRVANSDEINNIVAAPQTPAQQQLADFVTFEQDLADQVKQAYGISITTNPDDAPPEVGRMIRAHALVLASQGHGFERLYNRYYRRVFGPISKEF